MLSLFFSVGIYCILRYGSSNTSMVDIVISPTPFVSPKKGVMKAMNLEGSKARNAAMIDLVFGLMFDILWLSPYDRRRQEPAFVRFECCARRMVMGLRVVDGAEPDGNECEDIQCAVAELADSVEQLRNAGVIPPAIYLRASEQVRTLISALESEPTAAGTPSR